MPLTENEELWYKKQIKKYDPKGEYIVIDDSTGLITYTSKLKSDEVPGARPPVLNCKRKMNKI